MTLLHAHLKSCRHLLTRPQGCSPGYTVVLHGIFFTPTLPITCHGSFTSFTSPNTIDLPVLSITPTPHVDVRLHSKQREGRGKIKNQEIIPKIQAGFLRETKKEANSKENKKVELKVHQTTRCGRLFSANLVKIALNRLHYWEVTTIAILYYKAETLEIWPI